DLRYGARMLRKNPGFTAVAVMALAIGIGANTVIFSCVNALLLRPFDFSTTDRLVMVWTQNLAVGAVRNSVSPGNFMGWREQASVFEELVTYNQQHYNLMEGDQPERVSGARVTPNFFKALDARAERGRVFLPEEGEEGRNLVVLVKHSLWQRRFGSDPALVGKTISLDGRPHMVVGIMPQDFEFPMNGSELWAPFAFSPKEAANRYNNYLQVFGLLKPGVTREQAQAEMKTIAERQQQQYPETNTGRTVFVETLTDSFSRGSRMYLIIMMWAVGFVLLIACANVANLLLVRGASRRKELAIRLALGAGRWRVIRQLLTESVLLALLGGALGVFLSVWGIEFTSKGIPPTFTQYIPGWRKLGLDAEVLGFTLLASLVTGLVFGLAPALQVTRVNFNESLKEGGKGSGGGGSRNRLRSVLVVTEVALSLVLLIGAGLMIRSFVALLRADLGVRADNVLTLELTPARDKYPEPQQRIEFYEQLLRRVGALPGVSAAAAVNFVPMDRGFSTSSNFKVVGQPDPPKGQEPYAEYRMVSPRYFEAIGTPLRQGRVFNEGDDEKSTRVVIVGESLARRFFPGGSAVGNHIVISEETGPLEIVGVAADVKDEDIEEEAELGLYLPYRQDPWWRMALVIRTAADPEGLAPAVRSEVRALDRDLPVYNVRTMQAVIAESLSPKRLAMFMFAAFAVCALLLAGVGIYAVMSYAVTQRTHEIGIRMALGAQASDILRMVVGHGVVLTLAGLGIGLAASFAMTRAMSQMLYGVSATDPLTFAGISLLLAGVALLASFIPARRATKVDPMVALRYE
ncbi:MAG: ABC transporter permease, partial [Acidobacteria bacterium]|nr:ABC transporter permease [Acidobacteriota bacterium]